MKIKKKYLILMVITLLVSVGTLTYAYFEGIILNDGVNTTKVTTGSININISDTSVVATDVKPLITELDTSENSNQFVYEQASFVKKFTISNDTDSLNVCTGLYLKINSIDSPLVSQYFRYKIVQDDTGTSIEGDFSNASIQEDTFLGSLYFFSSGESKSYTMYIWIEYDDSVAQTSMLNKTMNATLYVKAVDCKLKENCDTRTTYSINYKLNGGSGCYKTSINANSTLGSICEPYRDGYNFVGWYSDAKLSTEANISSSRVISDDVMFYAKWQKDSSGGSTTTMEAPTLTCVIGKISQTAEVYFNMVSINANLSVQTGSTTKYCINSSNDNSTCKWVNYRTGVIGNNPNTANFQLPTTRNYYGWIKDGDVISKVGSVTCPVDTVSGGSGTTDM